MPELCSQSDYQLFMVFVEIVDFNKFDELVEKHMAWLTRKFEEGVFVVTGGLFEDEGPKSNRALAIAQAPNLQVLQELLSDDPFVVNSVCQYTFRRYLPRMHTEALGRLLSLDNSTSVALR